MAEQADQIELELDTEEDTEVSVEEIVATEEKEEQGSSSDQFDKSNTATQKRIDRLD